MIVKNFKIFSQNVHKNSLIVNTILETQDQFDIIFIQEPPWSEICKVPSSSDCEEESLMGTNHHPNWLSFTRIPSDRSDSPSVIAYINIHLFSLRFLLRKDIINHRVIILISFVNNHVSYFIMNMYSDSFHSALKYLKDTEVNIDNVFLMTGDFNIRDSLWDFVRCGSHWGGSPQMDSEISGLVERPWLQLMCCAVCLPHGRNFG